MLRNVLRYIEIIIVRPLVINAGVLLNCLHLCTWYIEMYRVYLWIHSEF